MAPTKKNLPINKKNKSPEDPVKRNTQSRDEVNQNEERIKAGSRNQGKLPLSERPEVAAEQRDDHQRQTTGSNVPGSEIPDRKNQRPDEWQTSQGKYPTNSKSSPVSDIHHPGQHHTGFERNRPNQMYTGNSEQSGQQYSVDNSSSQKSGDQIKQSRKNQADRSDGSDMATRQNRQQKRSENAAGARNQMETDQTPAKRKALRKNTSKHDGEK